jgi:Zn-dependent membrane protease YugP
MIDLAGIGLFALAAQYSVAFDAARRLRRSWCAATAWSLGSEGGRAPAAQLLIDGAGARVAIAAEAWPGGYRRSDRTLLLAPDTVAAPSLAALAVVVHEVGHADQHRAAPVFVSLGQALRRIVPFIFLDALALGALAVAIGSARGLLIAEGAGELALLLALVASLLERDASARGARLLAGFAPLPSEEAAALRTLLVDAAWSYLALPFFGLPPLGTRSSPPPSGAP